jgi:septum formation inhibitor-activating ATPase MinD
VFPNDYRQAVAAINKGQPLAESPSGKLSESFQAFASELTGQSTPVSTQDTGGLWGWLTPKRSLSS